MSVWQVSAPWNNHYPFLTVIFASQYLNISHIQRIEWCRYYTLKEREPKLYEILRRNCHLSIYTFNCLSIWTYGSSLYTLGYNLMLHYYSNFSSFGRWEFFQFFPVLFDHHCISFSYSHTTRCLRLFLYIPYTALVSTISPRKMVLETKILLGKLTATRTLLLLGSLQEQN